MVQIAEDRAEGRCFLSDWGTIPRLPRAADHRIRWGRAVVRCCDAGMVLPPGESRSKSRASRRPRRALSTIGAEWVFFGSEQRPDPVPGYYKHEPLPENGMVST